MAVHFPETMRLVDAKPGDVLVDCTGDVWCVGLWGADKDVWYRSYDAWRQWLFSRVLGDERCGPFRRATSADVEGIPASARVINPGNVRWGLDANGRVFRAEVNTQDALLAEYQRLAAADGEVAHERALTPTELAALGRKPIAPADPLGWEVE